MQRTELRHQIGRCVQSLRFVETAAMSTAMAQYATTSNRRCARVLTAETVNISHHVYGPVHTYAATLCTALHCARTEKSVNSNGIQQ